MDKTQQIAARRAKYDKITRVTDDLGRSIGIRPLTPSKQLRVREMAPGLDGEETYVDPESGRSFKIPKTMPLVLAAAVCEIDGSPLPFARTRGELDSVLDMLDQEGLDAVMKAMAKIDEGNAGAEAGLEAAKNSVETPA